MKKRIIISVTCIAVGVIYADAQNKNTVIPPQPALTEIFSAPSPPVPPIPPVPPLHPSTDGIESELPKPPAPPAATSTFEYKEFNGPEIINNNGNEISIRTINGKTMVIVKKEGNTQKIKLTTWNANRKYFEKKYGQLPPPPPPAPVVE